MSVHDILKPKSARQIIETLSDNEVDIEKYYDLVRASKDDTVILYPERAMTFTDAVCYRPFVKSVVTENPWVISCYDRNSVWVVRDGKWENPSEQTYGCSVNIITGNILGCNNTIPFGVIGGLEEIERFRDKIRNNKLQSDRY